MDLKTIVFIHSLPTSQRSKDNEKFAAKGKTKKEIANAQKQ